MKTAMRKITQVALFTTIAMLTLPAMAMPTQYSFSYDFTDGRSVGGNLWGELQADMNTIHVSDFTAGYNTLVMFVEFEPRDLGTQQIATLDGSAISLAGITLAPVYSTVFFFGIESATSAFVSGFDIFSSNVFDLDSESFTASNWSLTAIDPIPTVPAPASLLLVGLGIAALVFGRVLRSFGSSSRDYIH